MYGVALYHPEALDEDAQGQDQADGPADVAAGDLPVGGLGLLHVADPERQVPAEQLVRKQDGERGHGADEHTAEPRGPPRNLWSDKRIRCILKKLHLFIKFMDEGKYESTKKTMDRIGYLRAVCHCFFCMDI